MSRGKSNISSKPVDCADHSSPCGRKLVSYPSDLVALPGSPGGIDEVCSSGTGKRQDRSAWLYTPASLPRCEISVVPDELRPPQPSAVTVIVRPGLCVFGPNEGRWLSAWLESSPAMAA